MLWTSCLIAVCVLVFVTIWIKVLHPPYTCLYLVQLPSHIFQKFMSLIYMYTRYKPLCSCVLLQARIYSTIVIHIYVLLATLIYKEDAVLVCNIYLYLKVWNEVESNINKQFLLVHLAAIYFLQIYTVHITQTSYCMYSCPITHRAMKGHACWIYGTTGPVYCTTVLFYIFIKPNYWTLIISCLSVLKKLNVL